MDQKDKSQSLLTHLKYCCLTNLGNLLLKKLCYFEALNHYQKVIYMKLIILKCIVLLHFFIYRL